jgi:Rrf2 family protein
LPERFLVHILRTLVTGGILRSGQGVSGGYSLARAPDEITLLDILDCLEPPSEPTTPQLFALPANARQQLEVTLAASWQAARRELSKLTIADLANCHQQAFGDSGFYSSSE